MVFRISVISVGARYYVAITLKYDPVLNCAIFSEVPEVASWQGTFTFTVWPALVDDISQ